MHCVVDVRPRAAEGRLRVRPIRLGPLARTSGELACEGNRLIEELGRLEQRVRDPQLRHLGRSEQAVLTHRVRNDHLDRGLRPDESRQELRSAPRGKEPEEHLRERELMHRAGDRARRAVERELDAAAEACAVDRRDGRKRQGTEPAEQLVTRTRAGDRPLSCDARELRDIGSRGKEGRLAGDHRRAEVTGLQLAQQAVERSERGLAEERRSRRVFAVVDRDERDVAGTFEPELGDRRHAPESKPGFRARRAGLRAPSNSPRAAPGETGSAPFRRV